jgi:hypothetical protein
VKLEAGKNGKMGTLVIEVIDGDAKSYEGPYNLKIT